jgi:putative ABC transport system substrate-binding protein
MKKIFFTLITVLTLTYFFHRKKNKLNKRFTVGIIQSISNPSLDLIRNSFIEELKKKIGEDSLSIEYQNGEGSYPNTISICEIMKNNSHINLFFTIGGCPSQNLSRIEKIRPILFTGVSDPILHNLNRPNVCGFIDTIDTEKLISVFLKNYSKIPSISLIREGDIISQKEFDEFRNKCKELEIEFHEYIMNNQSEVTTIMDQICSKQPDTIILIPCSSLVVSTLPYIIKITKKNNISLITTFLEGKEYGATHSTGIDYSSNGILSAKLAYKLLTEKNKPEDFGFQIAPYA